VPDAPGLSGRARLAATGLQSPGFSGEGPKSLASRKASVDVVAEARGAVAVNEIQRFLESLPDDNSAPIEDRNRKIPQPLDPSPAEDAPAGPISPLRLHGPVANTALPRGAFP
jgi:hypothetical protein